MRYETSELTLIVRDDPGYLRVLLERTAGNVTHAARAGGVSRPFFWYLLRKYGFGKVPLEIRQARRARLTLPDLE